VAQTASAAHDMADRTTGVSAEARQTGMRAAGFLNNTTPLNAAMNALISVVIHVIHISSGDVDRREHRRRSCLVDASVTCSGQTGKAVVRDIPEGGCMAETDVPCQFGQPVELALDRSGIRVPGTVVQLAEHGPRIAFTGDGLRPEQADDISLETIPDLVTRTKADHIAFVQGMADAVESNEALPGGSLATAHHCRLCQWYDGVSDPTTRALVPFKAIEEPHHIVHDASARALVALAAGDMAMARRELAAVQQASDQSCGFGQTRPRLSLHHPRHGEVGCLTPAGWPVVTRHTGQAYTRSAASARLSASSIANQLYIAKF